MFAVLIPRASRALNLGWRSDAWQQQLLIMSQGVVTTNHVYNIIPVVCVGLLCIRLLRTIVHVLPALLIAMAYDHHV